VTVEAHRAVRRIPTLTDLRTVAGFAAVYVVAALLGRLTVLTGGSVSLVWPAAGVSVLWLTARSGRPAPWLDVAVLAVSTWFVVVSTGASPGGSLVVALAVVAQAEICCLLLARFCPAVWRSRGSRQLARVEDLWWLVLAAVGSSVLSAPVAAMAAYAEGASWWSWEVVALWSARNTVSVVTVVTLGLSLREGLRRRRSGATGSAPPHSHGHRAPVGHERWEYTGALLVAPLLYCLWFVVFGHVALVFPLITLTIWAGARLPTPIVVLHNTFVAVVAVALTLAGVGPFLSLGDAADQVMVAQLYVGMTATIGLALALSADERRRLVGVLARTRDRAVAQAALLTAIVDTMAEGVRVVDAVGHVLVRNPAATRLLTGAHRVAPGAMVDDLGHLMRLDGSALPPEELPYRAALAGRDVRDLALLVQLPGEPDPRTISFTSVRLGELAGGGVLTVLRDVTDERAELRRAAQVQASLLPARTPEVPGYEVAARFVPAGSVGGDLYDWQLVPGGLVITLADVMGKGAGAAILAATIRSVLHANEGPDVAASMVAAEHALKDDLANAGAFVTMLRAHVDCATGRLTYADAGHGLTLVISEDGSTRRLPANGLPLGIVAGADRRAATDYLAPGDLLLTFSDGILDTLGGSISDLMQVEHAVRGAPSAEVALDRLLGLVGDSGPWPDDLTVIALLRRPLGPPSELGT
jgi:PAS domain-containing protein